MVKKNAAMIINKSRDCIQLLFKLMEKALPDGGLKATKLSANKFYIKNSKTDEKIEVSVKVEDLEDHIKKISG